MCVVSNVGDYWTKEVFPNYPKAPIDTWSLSEVVRLKRDLEALKKLLKAALEFDQATGQPHCEHEAKIKLIKQMADIAGVDLEGII